MITCQDQTTELSKYSRFSKNLWVVVRDCLKHSASQIPCSQSCWVLAPFPGINRHSKLPSLYAPPHSSPASSAIRLLLLIFLVALLCGTVLFCFHWCLRRSQIGFPRRTLAVFAVGDLDPVYGKLSAYSGLPLWNLWFVVNWKPDLWKAYFWASSKILSIEDSKAHFGKSLSEKL